MNQAQPNLNPKDGKPVTCENCGGRYFDQVTAMIKFSKILTGSPQDTIMPIPTYRCSDCGNINEEFRIDIPTDE